MGLIKFIRRQKRKRSLGILYRQREGIAYHEAGHCVIGYIHGHSTNFIDINLDEKNEIFPQVDKNFNCDTQIVKAIFENDQNILIMFEFSTIVDVAKKYCIGLFAGTYSEYKFLYNREPRIKEISKHDFEKIFNCIQVLYIVSNQKIDRNVFLSECRSKTKILVYKDINYIKISKLAQSLISAKKLILKKSKIEKLIK